MENREKLKKLLKNTKFDDDNHDINSFKHIIQHDFLVKFNKYKEFFKLNSIKWSNNLISIVNIDQISSDILDNTNKYLPKHISNDIRDNIKYKMIYSLKLYNIDIKVSFYLYDNDDLGDDLGYIHEYREIMMIWILFCILQTPEGCSSKRNVLIDIYFTDHKKILPNIISSEILSSEHINSAFTYRCGGKELGITVYRKEEWFKVLLHESIHYFGLDTILNDRTLNNDLANLFNINSSIDVYESYCEFWSRLINTILIEYKKNKFIINKDIFLNIYKSFEIERKFTCFQCVKMLAHMRIDYNELINPYNNTINYKEKTHVFGYYILSNIFINNYVKFLIFLKENNKPDILRFYPRKNLNGILDFIKNEYNSEILLKNINKIIPILIKLEKQEDNSSIATARMSINEL